MGTLKFKSKQTNKMKKNAVLFHVGITCYFFGTRRHFPKAGKDENREIPIRERVWK